MKKSIKYFMMAAVALLSMSACNNEMDEQIPANDGKLQPVQFQMTFAGTRTTTGADRTTTWKEGDAIGIFAYPAGKTTDAVATNVKYTLGADKNWTAAEGTEIYPDQALDYYAYYPYQENVTDPAAISVAALADQSTADESAYANSDVLASQNKNVAAGAETVQLSFSHMFAMVEVKVQGDMVTKQPTKVELLGVKLNATLDLTAAKQAATLKDDATAQDITMFCLVNPEAPQAGKPVYSFRAVVPTQTVAANTPLVRVVAPDDAGKTYTMQHSAEVPYVAGAFRQMIVNVGSSRVSLVIPAGDITVNPWDPSDAINGEGSEVVTPVTTFSPQFDPNTTFENKGIYNNEKITGDTDGWFHRENTSALTTVSIDETDGTAIKLAATVTSTPAPNNKYTYAGRGSWNNSNIVYHCTSLFERTTYILSLKVKSSTDNGNIGVGISGSQDDKFFQIYKNDWSANWERSVTTTNGIGTSDWTTVTVNLDFSQAFNDGKSSGINGTNFKFVATEDSDVKGINIYLYNYYSPAKEVTNEVNELLIKDITITKYIPTSTTE